MHIAPVKSHTGGSPASVCLGPSTHIRVSVGAQSARNHVSQNSVGPQERTRRNPIHLTIFGPHARVEDVLGLVIQVAAGRSCGRSGHAARHGMHEVNV